MVINHLLTGMILQVWMDPFQVKQIGDQESVVRKIGHFHGSKCSREIQPFNGCLYRYGCFQKSWYPQIIHFNRVFHYNPSILGENPLFLETSISMKEGIPFFFAVKVCMVILELVQPGGCWEYLKVSSPGMNISKHDFECHDITHGTSQA